MKPPLGKIVLLHQHRVDEEFCFWCGSPLEKWIDVHELCIIRQQKTLSRTPANRCEGDNGEVKQKGLSKLSLWFQIKSAHRQSKRVTNEHTKRTKCIIDI